MKKSSLLYRLITTFTTIIAIILVLFSIILTLKYKSEIYSIKKSKMETTSDIIEEDIINSLKNKEKNAYDNLQKKLDFIKEAIDVDILVTDNVGFIYAGSKDIGIDIGMTKLSISDEYMVKLKRNEIIPEGEIGRTDLTQQAYLQPVFNDREFCGVIVMMLSEDKIAEQTSGMYKTIWVTTLFTLVILAFSVGWVIYRKLINPINEINRVANRIGKGEVDKRILVESEDEIGKMARSFNLMAESLEAVDANRRDFISNVSHELRSPITSMKGFIAGMIDGVIPKDKEEYYLHLVYDEINRLSRLVNDLLDLSSMEVGKFKLTIMEVDLHELIRRCLLNIESKVKAKNIRVNAMFKREHLYVYADSDRIIQVITNLLDNAIKYGGENGTINISTKIKGTKVYTSFHNDGPQMTEDELVHIWDRFYKTDKSRTNKESTGLGLPIVRLILTQHKEDIWAKNAKEGVIFTFTLTKV